MKKAALQFLFILVLIVFSGCAAQQTDVPPASRWATISGRSLDEDQAGEQFFFNIFVDEGMLQHGPPIKIKVNGAVFSGSLQFELRNPQDKAVWSSGLIGPGDFSITADYDLSAAETGTYQLGIVYSENVSATYNLGWHALKLSPIVLLPGAGMIVVGLGFILYARRQKILGWRYLGLGGLFWVITVLAKFVFAIPVNPVIYHTLGVSIEQIFSPGNIAAYVYIGALTGIFEAGLAYLILRRIKWGRAMWDQALVFGIGFGVIEALLLGSIGFGSAFVGLTSPETIPIPTLGNLTTNATLLMGLAPVIERLSVIFAHIFACVLIFYAIASGEQKRVWWAIGYKTLLDTPAGFASFWGTGTPGKIWTIEAVLFIIGLVGLWGTIQVGRRYPKVQPGIDSEQSTVTT